MDEFVVLARRNERWHRVHVGRENDAWQSPGRRNNVRAIINDVLNFYSIAPSLQQLGERVTDLKFVACD
jgi:hypothetical protein